jgi:hypothetical protein
MGSPAWLVFVQETMTHTYALMCRWPTSKPVSLAGFWTGANTLY